MNVISEIVTPGFCVGCGVCVNLCSRDNLEITWNRVAGEYQLQERGRCIDGCDLCLKVCPRFTENENQYEIAKNKFGAIESIELKSETGYYLGCFAGYVKDSKLRNRAASGGLCTAFLKILLEVGEIDAVVCVRQFDDSKRLFKFFIATTVEHLFQAAGSVYHPVEMSDVIREILEQDDKRYAVVALPCFLHAVSLAQKKVPKLNRVIKYKIGLVCGSLPNGEFNRKILAQFNVTDENVRLIKFRDTTIFPNRFKGMQIINSKGKIHCAFNAHEAKIRRSGKYIYTACMLCSDIFAEVADAVFMDAWLPEYHNDHFGTSLLLVRNQELMAIANKEIAEGGLTQLWETSIDKIIASQQPRVINKRQGLLHRIELCRRWGITFPANIHLTENIEPLRDKQKRYVEVKFARNLLAHGIPIGKKQFLSLLPHLVVVFFVDCRQNIKEFIRKIYFKYKYLRKNEINPERR